MSKLKMTAELVQDDLGTAIDVSIDGECESILAEKTLYCLLSSVYDKAPGVVIHAMETFVKNKLGVNND